MKPKDMRIDDKRRLANQRVRTNITNALFDLMEQKPYPSITIKEIVEHAGVARQSFYRNFGSKGAVIEDFFYTMYEDNKRIAREQGVRRFDFHMLVTILEALKKRRREIVLLNRNGFANRNLEMVNSFVELVAGNMPMSSIEHYHVYYFAGALYNTALKWLEGGAKEKCEQMAQTIVLFQASDLIEIDLDE